MSNSVISYYVSHYTNAIIPVKFGLSVMSRPVVEGSSSTQGLGSHYFGNSKMLSHQNDLANVYDI